MNQVRVFRALLVLTLPAAAIALWLFQVGPEVRMDVAQGQSAADVARSLKSQGVIRSPLFFRVLCKLTRWDRDIKPGVYLLRRRMSSFEALWRLTHTPSQFVKIVVPEGFSARQIAQRLEAHGVASGQEFLEHIRAKSLEGYLLPTTYYFSRGMRGPQVADHMNREFRRAVEPEFRKSHRGMLSPEQVVILASIVEREAVKPEEKPLIAAVYLNRLARRQPLEADPTVQYALGYWKKNVNHEDLKTASSYNTYMRYGLPPGPICSPGLGSIRAVLSPARTGALYFVADNTGGHTFSLTFEEHLKAKERAKRGRRPRAR